MKLIEIETNRRTIDGLAAREVAKRAANEKTGRSVLLSYHDAYRNEFHPKLCRSTHQLGHLVYGFHHGADIWVKVNGDAYDFLFRSVARDVQEPERHHRTRVALHKR